MIWPSQRSCPDSVMCQQAIQPPVGWTIFTPLRLGSTRRFGDFYFQFRFHLFLGLEFSLKFFNSRAEVIIDGDLLPEMPVGFVCCEW